MAATRTKADIEAEIAAARGRLAGNVEGLINQVHPKAVVQRGIDDARSFAAAEYASARSQFIDAQGALRLDRIGLIAGAVVGTVTFLLLVRSLVGRSRA
ncbi:MAG: DUF3618 domain-containing protein [Micropruina sp.]